MVRRVLVRYQGTDGCVHHGEIEGGVIHRLEDVFADGKRTGKTDVLNTVKVLAPVESPRIFGFAYNYNAHTKESAKEVPTAPVVFMKPSTSVAAHGDSIVYPEDGELVHYEGELTLIIGKKGRHISEAEALDHVLGYTCGNDVSDRIVQRRESAFGCLLAGKGYDTFAPIGPYIVTGLDPADQRIITRVNGVVCQDGHTADLLFSVPYIISYLSRFMTLLPGDVIMTGTPAGVGPIKPGDVVEVEIPDIGVLRNDVVLEVRKG